jgi:malonyl CoA-acyl carrier protein transacylase
MSSKALGLVQVSSVGAGYEALQIASKMEILDIHEFIPLAGTSQILVSGPMESLIRYRKILRTADLVRSVFIENPDPRILKSFYHLENHPVDSYLLVFEGSFVGDLFQVMQELFQMGLNVCDFRFPRFTEGKSMIAMTGPDFSVVEKRLESLASKNVHVTFIEEPSPVLKQYFTLNQQT